MKISTKGEYGLRAMLFLALRSGDKPVTSSEIAQGQSIPEPYLRQILAHLSKDRLIHSSRGPQGGHTLARSASEISIRDILISLEGQTTSVDQILTRPGNDYGPGSGGSILEMFLEVKTAVDALLAGKSLADLALRETEQAAAGVNEAAVGGA